jgi:hypothetical protein
MRVWVAVNAVILALVAAWAFRNFTLALRWSAETQYTAGQLGRLVKACYLALTFCLGETVNPLNLWVVIPAFLGFGVAMGLGLLKTASRRRSMAVFLFLQAATVCLSGIFLGAAAPKHLVILLPAWCGLLALGVVGGRKFLSVPAAALILLTTFASLFNYFTDRQFADADMVTPWREMAAAVERSESSNDAIEIGYQMDRGAYDMFRRYYRGRLQPQYVKFADWRGDLEGLRRTHPRVILLLHDGDPWEDIETWLKQSGARFTVTPFQMEEHTIKELREGFGSIGKYRTPLYRLYVIEAR